jgi:FHS family L-fucose permease-like MFS transporter
MNMPALIMEHSFTRWMVDTALGKSQTPDAKAIVGVFVAFFWLNAMLGRFIGAYLTQKFPPAKVLASFALLAIAMLALSMGSVGFVAMFSILGVGLFNSIMFPTLFTLTLEGLGPLKPQASGILVTAVVGGAIIPPLYGLLTDYVGFKTAFLLLIACYAYILIFARSSFKLKQSV